MGESEILSGTSLQSYTTHFLDLFAKFHTLILITGWRRLIGYPKLQIIFHKRATKYRSLLRKMTYKDNGSYESSPPCTHTHSQHTHTLNTHTLSTHTHSQHTHTLNTHTLSTHTHSHLSAPYSSYLIMISCQFSCELIFENVDLFSFAGNRRVGQRRVFSFLMRSTL